MQEPQRNSASNPEATLCSVNRRRTPTNSPTFLPRGGNAARSACHLERSRQVAWHPDVAHPKREAPDDLEERGNCEDSDVHSHMSSRATTNSPLRINHLRILDRAESDLCPNCALTQSASPHI